MKQAPLKILLIEDSPGDARLIREMLVEACTTPFELECRDRLATGLEALKADEFDLLLLDLSLPDGQGLETFVLANREVPTLPIVVLTGLDDETVAVGAVQAGAQDYLLKGHVDGHELLLAIRYAIERKRLEVERGHLLAREQTARAVAERLAAERAAILGQVADAVVIADPAGGIAFVNEAGRQLLGIVEKNGHRSAYAALHHLLDGAGRPFAHGQSPLERAALRGDVIVDAELRIKRGRGKELFLQGSATPVRAEDGTRLGAVLTLHDVTAQRELERQKDEFFANISHDLRTPLAAIKASIGVVLANEPSETPPPLQRMFSNVDQAADEMSRLVDDILELTRLRSGRVQLRPLRVDFREIAERAARAIEPVAASRQQTVVVDVPRERVRAPADAERLSRALMNLLTNAHKYGREGGRIRVLVRQAEEEALLGVEDDGPGIPEADQERIFDRFYRSESLATRRTPGSGLGLPIARAMVELHGGRIWVESAPGVSTTFWIAIPGAGVPATAAS